MIRLPGLLFLFGVVEISFSNCGFGFGVSGMGWQNLLLLGWLFFIFTGSLVPPATFTVGFSCVSGLLGMALKVGCWCKFIVAGSLVPPAISGW